VLEGSVCAPLPKPSVNGLPRREVAGQEPPGAAAFEDIEDGVQDLAGAVGFRSASFVGSWNVRLQSLPLGVSEMGWVAPFHAQERTSLTYPTRFFKQFRKVCFANFARTEFSAPLCQAALREGACESATRLL
jgi:hypothetical protein